MSSTLTHRGMTYLLLLVSMLISSGAVIAQNPNESEFPGPGEVIEVATHRIMATVREAQDYFDESPERYFDAIGDELDEVVDFRGFARSVMGSYASSKRYRSLDDAGQEQLRDQLDRFATVLREGLIKTYSRGLLAFGGSDVELANTEFSPENPRVASVTQKVNSDDGQVYTVQYQMGQYRDGHWALRNMIIENINLGEIYRSQFDAAARQASGDLDQVISGWDDASVAVATSQQGGDNGSE